MDTGYRPIIGATNENRAARARAEGFEVTTAGDAAARADVKIITLPDEQVPDLYLSALAPSLKEGDVLVFSSGYSIAFGYLEPPAFVDTVMIAPRTYGTLIRAAYETEGGFLSFLSVEQDATGRAWGTLLALAWAVGALGRGAFEITFRQEAELTHFIDQGVMPALHHLIATAAEVLVKENYPVEAAFLDAYLAGKLSAALAAAGRMGVMPALRNQALVSQYGTLSRLDRVHDLRLRRNLSDILNEIREGKFARNWADEYLNGYPRLEALLNQRERLPLWAMEQSVLESLREINALKQDGTTGEGADTAVTGNGTTADDGATYNIFQED